MIESTIPGLIVDYENTEYIFWTAFHNLLQHNKEADQSTICQFSGLPLVLNSESRFVDPYCEDFGIGPLLIREEYIGLYEVLESGFEKWIKSNSRHPRVDVVTGQPSAGKYVSTL